VRIKEATTIFHFPRGGLNGDYTDVELVIELSDTVRREIRTFSWGDQYHEKGEDRADAAILVLKGLLGDFPHEVKNVDDREALD
jgi:hypothetical protein